MKTLGLEFLEWSFKSTMHSQYKDTLWLQVGINLNDKTEHVPQNGSFKRHGETRGKLNKGFFA